MSGWFEISQASNGEIILTSEQYKAKASAKNGIASVQKNSQDDGRYDRLTSKNDKPYFNLKAANHQIIGTSQLYTSEQSRDKGIELCESKKVSYWITLNPLILHGKT